MDKSNFTPRAILATNIKLLMAAKSGPGTQSALHEESGVAQSTIGRILGEGGENARIETVDRLAKAYGLEGWQLLVPGMDPENAPALLPVSKAEKALYATLKAAMTELSKSKQ